MLEMFRRVARVAPTTLPVLVVGETGTGKELVAHAVHELSGGACKPFIAVNCAAIPESLAEAELFGVEPGAYTGAVRRRRGWLELAHGGTLFLDEVCSMPRPVQAKLLRALESRSFARVGGEAEIRADFRLVAATSEAPAQLASRNAIRRDFLHRLGSCRIVLPPLRERGGDAVLLAQHYLTPFGASLSPGAQVFVKRYQWPGNVRELRATMEALGTLHEGPEFTAENVMGELHDEPETSESDRLRSTLVMHDWNVTAAARVLGIGRTTIYALLRRYQIERPIPQAS